ncbi:MAG: TlpA family protein disulfide reductase, partial [Alphaproteobacteria bacterium]|nr:TlpA family protein disulfide reductase [Alphaproteobacteria bacterium]
MMKNIRLTILLGLFITTISCLQAQIADLDEKYAAELLKPGTPAPDFQLQTPDGKTLKFSDFAKGKYVVIDFWASWCPDC